MNHFESPGGDTREDKDVDLEFCSIGSEVFLNEEESPVHTTRFITVDSPGDGDTGEGFIPGGRTHSIERETSRVVFHIIKFSILESFTFVGGFVQAKEGGNNFCEVITVFFLGISELLTFIFAPFLTGGADGED